MNRYLHGKIILRGIIRTLTGLHIGASKEVVEIGAEDLPVIRNPLTREPYIPGSSLKGKMRALSERYFKKEYNRSIKKDIKIHVCSSKEQAIKCPVCRLFGSTAWKDVQIPSNFPSRLKVRDAFLTRYSVKELSEAEEGLLYTEVKFENVLDRVTASATPRQIERIPAGVDFGFEIVYDVEDNKLEDDIKNLFTAMKLIEDDTLGGHGSRGYGKIKFFIAEGIARKIEYYKGMKGNSELNENKGVTQEKLINNEKKEEKLEDKLYTLEEFEPYLKKLIDFFKDAVKNE